MREREGGGGPEGPPAGDRSGASLRVLAEAALVLAGFLAAPLAASALLGEAGRISSPAFHLRLAAIDALRTLLVLLVMARSGGLAAFGLGRIRWPDLPKGLLAAAGAIAVLLPPGFLFHFIGLSNPLMTGLPRATDLSLAPAFLSSSLATGYAEELFFRSYLMDRLRTAGLSPAWAAAASSIVFGAAHGAQGLVGIVSTVLIGLWFAWRWIAGRSIHEIAIGHCLYDASIVAFALYS